jgi:hypothetical protein
MARLSRIRAHATYANVTATLALFVALGGGSFAVAMSGSEKKVVKKIARKQADKRITARAPELSVAHAGAATRANSAKNAGRAKTAGNANLLGGVDSTGFIGSGAAAGGDLDGVYPNPTIADGAVTSTEIDDGTIKGTEFIAQGEASLNFPSINAGTCSALTEQRQGGDDVHLVVTPPSHFADTFTLTGKVVPVSLGTVQYKFVACNVFGGGGAADPDSSGGTYRYLAVVSG